MIYLVTGGTGFLGSYVVRKLLEDGHEVVCFQRSGLTPILQELVPEKLLNSKVKIVQGNVTEALELFEAIKKYRVESIVHVAYLLYPQSEIPGIAVQVNIVGTNNVFEAARLFDLKSVVWTSSMGLFGNYGQVSGDKVLTGKEVVYYPTRLYGVAKAFCESLGEQHRKLYGVNIIAMRLGRTYGIGKYRGSGSEFTDLLQKVALDQPATIPNGDGKWTHIYIEDCAKAIVKACDIKTTRAVLDISTGVYYNGWQVADIIRKIKPDAQIKVEPGTGVYDWPKLDVASSLKELGFTPRSLEEGMKQVMNYYRQQKGLPLIS